MSSYVAGKWLEDPEFELDIICIERGGTCIMFNSYLVDEDRDAVSAPNLQMPKLDTDEWEILNISFYKYYKCNIHFCKIESLRALRELPPVNVYGNIDIDLSVHTVGIRKTIWNLAVAAEREVEKYLIKGGKI